jgi:hypothetical protein
MSLLRRKNLKAAGVRLSGGLGWHSAPRTQRASLRGLLQALRPLDPGIDLIRIGPDNDGGDLARPLPRLGERFDGPFVGDPIRQDRDVGVDAGLIFDGRRPRRRGRLRARVCSATR